MSKSRATVHAPRCDHSVILSNSFNAGWERPFRSLLLEEPIVRRVHYYPRALRVAMYVQSRLPDQIGLSEAAKVAEMAPTAFSRYFSDKVGISFTFFVKTLRIERAIESIECSDCTIRSLSESSGYTSFCSFSRAFREVVGMTPSEYRRSTLASE